jgi:hypothetical protein
MNDKIELRAAAARLLYNNNRQTSDYDMLVSYIDNSKPVVHGKWLHDRGRVICSVCKKSAWSSEFEKMLDGFDFCPHCSADMRWM